MNEMQTKIAKIVSDYKVLYNDEYNLFIKGMTKRQRFIADNDKLGKTNKTDLLERALLEYPETLFVLFQTKLNPEEFKYLDSKIGVRWFAKKYKEFTLPEKL